MHIFERKVNGKRYRVAATSRRVRGKDQPVSRQVSLGPVDHDQLIVPSRCEKVGIRRLGDVGALIAVAEELGVLAAFDEVAPGDGLVPSLGEMVLAVAIQRVCAPGSKRVLPEFLAGCLPVFSVMKSTLFSGQAFHRVTRGIDDAAYGSVQRAIAQKAVMSFGLSTEVLAYDSTNFDTFLATTTESTLAQRGKAKSKRRDLRVVGLVLMTSMTGSVPLFHQTYPGNSNDTVVLVNTLEALTELHKSLGEADRTMVRDGGFYSEQLELELDRSGYHSITCVPLSCNVAKEALEEAVGNMKPLGGELSMIRVHRTRRSIGALERTTLVVESPKLLEGQLRGLHRALTRARKQVAAWATRIEKQREGTARGRHLTQESLTKKAEALLRKEWLSHFVEVDITSDAKGLVLRYREDEAAYQRLVEERLGKRVIISDRDDWSSEAIVRAFRSQWRVERANRRMKKGCVSLWGPSFQWTDDSLRAHTFATVLGLQLASLAALRMRNAGIDLPVKGAITLLSQIELTHLREKPRQKGRPRDVYVPPRLNKEQRRALKLFDLEKWFSLISAT